MSTDHYKALGIRSDASQEDVRAAYLRLVREHHPDHRPDDPQSADKVREANAAYEVLGDSARRAAYDRLRTTREASSDRRGARVTHHRGDATVARVAYSAEHQRFRREFSRSLLHYAIAAFLVGTVLLLATA